MMKAGKIKWRIWERNGIKHASFVEVQCPLCGKMHRPVEAQITCCKDGIAYQFNLIGLFIAKNEEVNKKG